MNYRPIVALAALAAGVFSATVAGANSTTHGIQVEECVPNPGNPGTQWTQYYGGGAPMGYWDNHSRFYTGPHQYNGGRYYEPGTPPTLSVGFTNTSPETATIIDFALIAKGHTVAIVRDKGSFSQGARIDHVLGLDPNVFPIGSKIVSCVPMHIAYANGGIWNFPKH